MESNSIPALFLLSLSKMLRDNYVIKLLFGEQGTATAVVGTVVRGI